MQEYFTYAGRRCGKLLFVIRTKGFIIPDFFHRKRMCNKIIRQRYLHPVGKKADCGMGSFQCRGYLSSELTLQKCRGTGKTERKTVFLAEAESVEKEKPSVDAI